MKKQFEQLSPFEQYLRKQNLSDNTVTSYLWTIKYYTENYEDFSKENLLAENCMTIAYSYIGPEVSHAIYRSGTIGKAKEHLENTAHELDAKMASFGGHAYVSVNKGSEAP